MEGALPLDLFATKGVEYLIVIAFLTALTVAWRLFRPPVAATVPAAEREREWRSILRPARTAAQDVLFHPGHVWARPSADGPAMVACGWDDFARRLVGPPEGFELPEPGTWIRAGEPAWSVQAGGKSIPMLSPVSGEVAEVNPAVCEDPSAASRDPYGDGWLLRVRVPTSEPVRRNLLHGPLARSWSELAERSLAGLATQAPGSALGAVLADGGEPRDGLARTLVPDRWEEVVGRYFLTAPDAAGPGESVAEAG
ncbi:MAG: glycine cleavage system protein H [Gemmatimonadota bacterium]|nr:glycine cleavage system protein H [Gemmatimonadota bacterium]